jgi:hypothetical protein
VAPEPEAYLEAVLELHESARPERVARWLESRALTATPVVAGMLTGGEPAALRDAFEAEPGAVQPGGTLPVPDELGDDVAAVHIVPQRYLHDG